MDDPETLVDNLDFVYPIVISIWNKKNPPTIKRKFRLEQRGKKNKYELF